MINIYRTIFRNPILLLPIGIAFLIGGFSLPMSYGQESPVSPSNADELEAIRAESQAFVAAFNKKDSKAIAALWTPDGEYTDESGRVFTGRDAIQKGYADFFAASGKPKIRVMIDSLRMLSKDSAIEDGRAILDPAPVGSPGMSKYTAIHVKVDGKWLMASVRDSWIATPSANEHVADFEWLIGTWAAEEHGVKNESTCKWVANKSYVERSYTITQVDGTKSSGVQIIGLNPFEGRVHSWNFNPDGGHAVGAWTPTENGWSAEMRGVTGDGTPTFAVNVLTKLDENAYAWQSIQRTLGGKTLPDTEQIVIKRQSNNR